MTSLNSINSNLWSHFNGNCPICQKSDSDCYQVKPGMIHCQDKEAKSETYTLKGFDDLDLGVWISNDKFEAYTEKEYQKYLEDFKTLRYQVLGQEMLSASKEEKEVKFADFSSNSEVNAQIHRFLSWGMPPLPCAKGKKEPSYHTPNGNIVYLPNWKQYQKRLPTPNELKRWFQHPDTGTGSISGFNGNFVIDFDSKHFSDPHACGIAVSDWRRDNGLGDSYVERTRSYGYHIAVKSEEKPTIYDFALSENGDRVGEILQKGTFFVSVGSQDTDGNRYTLIKDADPVSIDWTNCGLFQARKPEKGDEKQTEGNHAPETFKSLELPPNPLEFSEWEIVGSAINSLPSHVADDLNAWLIVGSACKAVDSIRGLELWINWSKQSTKYRHGDCRKRWKKLWSDERRIGALCNLASSYGWEHPRGSIPKDEWIKQREAIHRQNYENLIKLTPDLVIHEKFFTLVKELMESNQSLFIVSGLATGKTHFCSVQITLRYLTSGVFADFIGCLNNLLIQTGHRVSDPNNGIDFKHLRTDDAYNLIGTATFLLYCLDSIFPFSDYHFFKRDIYLDEINQFLRHAVYGETLGSNQTEALEVFEIATHACRKITALDGNGRDIEAKLLEAVTGKRFTKVLNTHKPPAKNVYFVDSVDEKHIPDYDDNNDKELTEKQIKAIAKENIKRADKSPMLQLMLAPNSRPFVTVDSLKRSKVYYKMLTMQGKKGYVLNSETSGEEWARLFMADPSEFIRTKKPDFIIISPSLQSGGDIHADNWFTAQFSFFCGVLMTDGQTQQLFRLRDMVDIYISCPDRGLPSPRYMPKSYYPDEVREQALKVVELDSRLIGNKDRDVDQWNRLRELSKESRERGKNDPWFTYWCELTAISNYQRDHLRECLESALKKAGHNVESVIKVRANQLKDWELEVKAEVEKEEAKFIYTARYVTDEEEAERLRRKDSLTLEERRILEKYILLCKIPGIEQTNFWQSDGENFILERWVKDKTWLSCLERFYFLQHPEIAEKRQDKNWLQRLKSEVGREFYGRTLGNPNLTIWALDQLGIMRLIGESVNKDHPIVKDIFEKGQNPEIILALGIEPGKPEKHDKHIMEYIKRLAELAGIPLKAKRKRDSNGKAIRLYSVDSEKWNAADRVEALAAISRRWEQWERETVLDWEAIFEQYDRVTVQPEEVPEMPEEDREWMTQFSEDCQSLEQQENTQASNEDEWESLPLDQYEQGQKVWYLDPNLKGEWREVMVDSPIDGGIFVEWLDEGGIACCIVRDSSELVVKKLVRA